MGLACVAKYTKKQGAKTPIALSSLIDALRKHHCMYHAYLSEQKPRFIFFPCEGV